MQVASAVPYARSGLQRLGVLAEHPAYVLGGLVVVQWIAVLVFALSTQRNGLLFYHGGDQTYFYTSAWSLSEGYLPRTGIGYAWPVVLAPIALVVGPGFLSALPVVLSLQFFVLLPVALLAVYGAATHVGGRLFGYWAAALWIVLPYAAIPSCSSTATTPSSPSSSSPRPSGSACSATSRPRSSCSWPRTSSCAASTTRTSSPRSSPGSSPDSPSGSSPPTRSSCRRRSSRSRSRDGGATGSASGSRCCPRCSR